MAKLDVRVALDELLLSQEKREALISSVKRLANDATVLKSKQDIHKDDISATAEALGIPSAKLNQFIKAYNDDLESVLGEMVSTADILGVIKDNI